MCRSAACLTVLLSVPSMLAAQDCPRTVADAAKGISVGYSDGSNSVFTLDLATGVVMEDWAQPGQPIFRNTLSNGLHLIELVDVIGVGETGAPLHTTYRFDEPPPAFTGPGQTWSIGYAMISDLRTQDLGTSDPDAFTGRYSGKVGAQTILQIGACAYVAFPVTLTLVEPAVSNLVKVDFVPSLGFSILRGFGVPMGNFTTLTPVSIAATVKP